MGYLVCEKCGGYYELQEGEALDDFQSCECGGKLKYVKNLDQLKPESNKHEKISVCSFCGTENLKDDKFCGNCGKPLNTTTNSKIPPKPKTKIIDRLSKYRNKRNYGFLAIGIVVILIIAVCILGFSSSKEFKVGDSTFSAPNDFHNKSYTNGADYSEIYLTKTNDAENHSVRSISVREYKNASLMNQTINLTTVGYNINDINTTQINGINVTIFNFVAKDEYYFIKNGKYYQITIKYRDTSQNDELLNMIVNSLK